MPSLIAAVGPLTDDPGVLVSNPVTAAGYALFFGALGIVIGVVYLRLMVRYLPYGNDPAADGHSFLKMTIRDTGKIILFVLFTLLVILAIMIPVSIGAGLLALVSPTLISLFAITIGGFSIVFFFYLYYVIVALITDNLAVRQAVMQSITLVRANFWSTLGFILLTSVINIGFGLIFGRLAATPPVGTLVAVLANSYIGTGLAMALLVFYRTRLMDVDERASFLELET